MGQPTSDLNTYNSIHEQSVTNNFEYHENPNCCFKLKVTYIAWHGHTVYVLYRYCICGRYESKYMESKYNVSEYDFSDGVELHLTTDCKYSRKHWRGRTWRLEKVCYCAGKKLKN